jgi:hypothetical protein
MVSNGTQRAFNPVEAFEKMGSVPTFPTFPPTFPEYLAARLPGPGCSVVVFRGLVLPRAGMG